MTNANRPLLYADDVVAALRSRRVKVTAPHVYQLMAKNRKPKRAKGDKYAALIEAKKLADKLGGVERAARSTATPWPQPRPRCRPVTISLATGLA
jgi:hypothetical protein